MRAWIPQLLSIFARFSRLHLQRVAQAGSHVSSSKCTTPTAFGSVLLKFDDQNCNCNCNLFIAMTMKKMKTRKKKKKMLVKTPTSSA